MGRKSLKKQIEELENSKIALENSKIALEAELQRVLEEMETARVNTKEQIDAMCADKYFCGLKLTRQNIVDLIVVAFNTTDDIKVNYELYTIEENEEIPLTQGVEENGIKPV